VKSRREQPQQTEIERFASSLLVSPVIVMAQWTMLVAVFFLSRDFERIRVVDLKLYSTVPPSASLYRERYTLCLIGFLTRLRRVLAVGRFWRKGDIRQIGDVAA
jgi:hypothetical protein